MSQFLPRALSQGRASLLSAVPRPPPARTRLPLVAPCTRLPLAAPLTQAARQRPQPATERSHSKPPLPPPSATAEQLSQLPYLVGRTASNKLPVYRRFKSGGTLQVVFIKKVQGDRRQMVHDLTQSLQIKKDGIRINPTTLQIELKGDYMDKTMSWLLQRGF